MTFETDSKNRSKPGAMLAGVLSRASPTPELTIDDRRTASVPAEFREVADLVMILASDRAAFITGQSIIFAGGRIIC